MSMLHPGSEAQNYKLYVRNCGEVTTLVYSTITGNGIVQESVSLTKHKLQKCSIVLHVNCKNSSFLFSFREHLDTYHGKDGHKG